MVGDARGALVAEARAREARGDVDGAAATYARAGEVDEAARVLIAAGRFGEAGRLLLRAVGAPLDAFDSLAPEARKAAHKAAICFARAGEPGTSVELFLALGDRPRAAEVLERSGDPVGAARIRAGGHAPAGTAAGLRSATPDVQTPRDAAKRLEAAGQLDAAAEAFLKLRLLADAARCYRGARRLARAGELFLEAGMPYEAAVCHHEAGDTAAFLDAVVRVPREHPRYRVACVEAVRVASVAGVLDFQLDHFLGRFVATGPATDAEVEAFRALATLYSRHDYQESARDVLARVVAARPGSREAADALAGLEGEEHASAMVDAKIRREDGAFFSASADRGRRAVAPSVAEGAFPGLPDLPPLPGAATIVGVVARPAPRPEPPPAAGTRVGLGARAGVDARTMASPGSEDGTQRWVPAAPRAAAPPLATPPPPDVGAPPSEGAMVAGRYRVLAKLGQGGMAVVYRALDTELGEEVAIKLFLQASDDAQMLQRFRQELAVCRQLSHPNVVRLYDIGTHEGRKFISMELLAGRDLAGLATGPMDVGRAVGFLLQACAGLGAAHERGVVHRDVKPENFFVTNEGVLKVMDFGIAKRTTSPGLTVAGFVAGTPEYMAPEQIQNFGTVTHLADLYALGIVAFQLFTGTVPFFHAELMPLLMMHVNTPAPAPSSREPGLPEEVDAVVLRLLEKDPAKRFPSCRDLARALRALVR
jgi:serine/threonine-protein kinase